MKGIKLATLFVLALFITSLVPAVFAEEDGTVRDDSVVIVTSDNDDATDADTDSVIETDVEASTDTDARKRFDENREDLRKRAHARRAELEQKRKRARVNLERKRDHVKERHKELRDRLHREKKRFHELRDKHKEIKEKRAETRDKFRDAKKHIREVCAEDPESDVCVEAKDKAKTNAADHLKSAAEHVLATLERTYERVENSDLGEDRKAKILAELEASIAEVGAVLGTLDELGEDITREDVKEAAKVLRDALKEVQKGIKHGIGRVASHRIGGVIKKMEKLDTKFDRVIAKLADKGHDVSDAEALKADFSAKLDSAEALHAEAKDLFEAGDHPAAAEKIRAAHKELKEAHRILKELVKQIRSSKNGTSALTDVSDEAEEEDSDDGEAEESEEEDSDDGEAEDEESEEEADDEADDEDEESEEEADDEAVADEETAA